MSQAETVIFDDELSPGQLRNLEKTLGEGRGPGEPSVKVGLCDPEWDLDTQLHIFLMWIVLWLLCCD